MLWLIFMNFAKTITLIIKEEIMTNIEKLFSKKGMLKAWEKRNGKIKSAWVTDFDCVHVKTDKCGILDEYLMSPNQADKLGIEYVKI